MNLVDIEKAKDIINTLQSCIEDKEFPKGFTMAITSIRIDWSIVIVECTLMMWSGLYHRYRPVRKPIKIMRPIEQPVTRVGIERQLEDMFQKSITADQNVDIFLDDYMQCRKGC